MQQVVGPDALDQLQQLVVGVTPEKARATGTDYIVVGRAVTAAADPQGAYLRCLEAFTGGMNL